MFPLFSFKIAKFHDGSACPYGSKAAPEIHSAIFHVWFLELIVHGREDIFTTEAEPASTQLDSGRMDFKAIREGLH